MPSEKREEILNKLSKMEHYKISKLLNNFNIEVNDWPSCQYSVDKNIRFKT